MLSYRVAALETDLKKDHVGEVCSHEIFVGQVISDSYTILRAIGSGGRATVYLAHDEQLQQNVALKIWHRYLNTDAINKERFRREAKIAAMLDHPYIVRVRSFGHHEEMPFLIMEYIPGQSLDHYIKQFGPLCGEDFKSIFTAIASALSYAHQNHVLHRDIKPGNIVVNRNELEHPKLVDFGMARVIEESEGIAQHLTRTTAVAGSPAYMSPEQCQGKPVDVRSDIYSLGVTMYEAVTGRLLFDADSELAVMSMHLNDEPVFPPNCAAGAHLRQIILTCLNKDPADRFQSAAELQSTLLGCDTSKFTADEMPEQCVQPQSKKAPLIIGIALTALLAVIGAATFKCQQRDRVSPLGIEKKTATIRALGHENLSARALNSEAQRAWGRGDPPEKIAEMFTTALKVAEREKQTEVIAEIHGSLGELLLGAGQIAEGKRHIENALNRLKSDTPAPTQLLIYRYAAHMFERDSSNAADMAKAEQCLFKALNAADQYTSSDDRDWRQALVLDEISDLYQSRHRYKEEMNYLKQAVDRFRDKVPETAARAAAVIDLALDYDQKLVDVAIKDYEDTRGTGTSSRPIRHLNSAARKLFLRKDYKRARMLALYALEDLRKESAAVSLELLQTLQTLAYFSAETGDLAGAQKYCQQALSYNSKFMNPQLQQSFDTIMKQAGKQ